MVLNQRKPVVTACLFNVVGRRYYSSERNASGPAKDGPEALEKTKELKPDVILLDVSMPGMSGLEVTRLAHRDFPAN
jgi:CheY-like chemotaxis protein